MIRVAHALPIHFDTIGGMQTHVLMLGRALRELGIEVTVVGKRGEGDDLPFVSPEEFDPAAFDVVHSHAQFGRYARAAVKAGARSVHTSHGTIVGNRLANRRPRSLLNPHNYISTYFEAMGYRWAQQVIAVSRQAQRELVRYYRVPSAKITVIPNGHSCSLDVQVDRSAERARWGIAPESFVFLFVGRDDDPQKRSWVVVKAFQQLSRQFSDARLVIAPGTIDNKDPRIIRTGPVSQEVVCRLYLLADAYLISSATEGFSLSLIDAMACGLPVVATPVGGALELIRHGESGLFARCRVLEFSAAMHRLIIDAPLRERLGDEARKVASEYVWRRIAERTAQVYARVLMASSA